MLQKLERSGTSMIQSVPNWQEQTPEELLDYLRELVTQPSGRGRLTHTWVADHIGLAVADAIYGAVNAVTPPTALRYAVGDGIDTSATLWKMQAEQVAQQVEQLAPHLDLLRDFELIRMPRWQSLGYPIELTIGLIQAEIDEANRSALIGALRSRFDAILNQIGTTEQAQAVVELRTIANELEGY